MKRYGKITCLACGVSTIYAKWADPPASCPDCGVAYTNLPPPMPRKLEPQGEPTEADFERERAARPWVDPTTPRSSSADMAIVDAGAAALRVLATRLRAEAERRESESALWLSVRDVEGLAGRLEEQREDELPMLLIGGQDIAVMDDVSTGAMEVKYGIPIRLTQQQRESVHRLRTLLADHV
jgi:hypothetical protein